MIVVGAGLVGTALAIHLAQAGFEVQVYEGRSDPRQVQPKFDRSINITLCERGFRALEPIGLTDVIRQLCIPVYGRMMHSVDGELSFQPYGNNDEALYSIRRYDLNRILLDHADQFENIDIHFNQKCLDVDLETATLQLQNRETGEISEQQGDRIFGTDGAYSIIRSRMQRLKRFNYSQIYWDHGYKEAILPPTNKGEWPLKKDALHIWPRDGFMLIAFPNKDFSFTITLHLPYEGEISYESLTTLADYQELFTTYFPDVLPLMAPHLMSYVNNPIESMVTIKCFPWAYKDKVLLLGDACHAIYPFYGQGANAGFEDCHLLMGYMQKYPNDWSTMLREYQTHRKPNTDAIADLSMEHFATLAKLVGDPKFRLRSEIERKIEHLVPDYVALYNNISFTSMPYIEAKNREYKNREIIDQLLTVEGIEEKLDQPETENLILSLLNNGSFNDRISSSVWQNSNVHFNHTVMA